MEAEIMNEIRDGRGSLGGLLSTANDLQAQIDEIAEGMDAAEGRRFLLRMLTASIETFVENDDVERPAFHHAESPIRKMFADCPDTDYLRAPIALGSGRCYRLSGKIPESTLYVGVLLYGKGGRIGNRLTDKQLKIDDQGRFELLISTEEQKGQWLQGEGDETAVMVRQYFGDRATQPSIEVDIELLGDPKPEKPLGEEQLAEQLDRSQRMLRAIVKRTRAAYDLATKAAVNQFIVIPGEQLFPTPDNKYSVAWYEKTKEEKVVVRGRMPKSRYFSLALYNIWLESLDFLHHQVALNHEQLKIADDGTFEAVLSDFNPDPGQANWLDTTGHQKGYVLARALLPEETMPQFKLDVVPR